MPLLRSWSCRRGRVSGVEHVSLPGVYVSVERGLASVRCSHLFGELGILAAHVSRVIRLYNTFNLGGCPKTETRNGSLRAELVCARTSLWHRLATREESHYIMAKIWALTDFLFSSANTPAVQWIQRIVPHERKGLGHPLVVTSYSTMRVQ